MQHVFFFGVQSQFLEKKKFESTSVQRESKVNVELVVTF